MNFQALRAINKEYTIRSIHDQSFITFGRIIDDNIQEALEAVSAIVQSSQDGNRYIPSVPSIEKLTSIQSLSQKVYGYMDVMAGLVIGHNEVLNGIEYHQCSEVILALTDYILVVGHRWDMKENTYDSSLCEIFYVPQGTIIECYATTLHYTPICVNDEGYQTICLLLRGTGDVLTDGPQSILKRKNKWFIAHSQNFEKVQSGDYPGLLGKMIHIRHN